PGPEDFLVLGDDRGRRLEKYQRLFGRIISQFFGMVEVIAPYADNFGGTNGRQHLNRSQRLSGSFLGMEQIWKSIFACRQQTGNLLRSSSAFNQSEFSAFRR